MKRILFSLFLAATGLSASAMNARDAREYAYFLTDKMAYELNLTPMQYERVYEVNLDYFLAVNSPYDVDRYQDYRDEDLRYILSDSQYWDYSNVNYFYRPLSWGRGSWVVNVYNRYTYRDNYYFGRPVCYASYQGSDWRLRSASLRSPYWNVTFDFRLGGMRDSYSRYYNTTSYVQPFQREPLIIQDGRYGGNYQVRDGRYGSVNGYYVAPSSAYYGSAARSYNNGTTYYGRSSSDYRYEQRSGSYYDGRRGSQQYYNNSDYNRSYSNGSYNGGRVNYGNTSGSNSRSNGSYVGGSYGASHNGSSYRSGSNYSSGDYNNAAGGNNGSSYSSGRRGSSVFTQPQRDARSNNAGNYNSASQGSSTGANASQSSSAGGSTRVVNGTTIVGGRR